MTKDQMPTNREPTPRGQRGRARKAKQEGALPRRLECTANGPLTPATPELPAERRSALASEDARCPLWVPQGADLEVVPQEVRQAIVEVVQPVYERIVLAADDPLEKSLGVTTAHLLWLEVLQQFDLKREYLQYSAVLGLSENRGAMIEQHLRIIYSKVKVGYFLARLRELRQKWEDQRGKNDIG